MKVKGSLYWIYSFTSGCKGKMLVAILLAVIGVLCGMAPYFALAGILSGLIQNTLTAERIFCYVGIAVLGETLKMLFNTVSSLKAHRVAYHILGNIRYKLAEKMMRVPMGVMVDTPSGKLKAMVVDTVDKLEQPLAHMLPEITANVFTPLCIIILLFILDWRMALACMIVIPIGALLLMGQMKDYKNRSDRYIEASSNMDSSLVEYVNGIEVIKTFSQTGKSFQKFSDAVKNYHDTTLDWWKNTWLYSALGLTVIPATLVGGIPVGAYLLMQGSISFSIYITCLILSLCGVYKTALKSTITYIVLLSIKYWILPFCPEIIMTSLNIVVITFRKLLPCVTLGALLVQTTPIRLLMHAMQKWHLPQAVIIPLAITVRYFPTLHEEQQAISDAMKLRNVHGVFQKLEYIYVPLMLSASTTADELSQAITARGIDNPRPKTCAVSMRFHIQDYVLCFVAIVLVISAFVLL